jgi:subtilisin family serine protease
VAALDNDTGVVGAAPEAVLCIYKVHDDNGNANWDDIIAAIEQAVTDGVQVLNHSYGDLPDPGPIVKAAFDNAHAAGVIHIGAAGNSGNAGGTGENCIYPARWDTVIAVGATTESDERLYFSSTCNELELAAPGGLLIYSTMPGGGYGYKLGTSMAAPHVAGTAALVLAAGWSSDAMRAQLQNTADDLGAAGRDRLFGYGLVDADEATGQPTAVTIASFSAHPQAGVIQVGWETILEINLLGFNIYRGESPEGNLLQINPELIKALSVGNLNGSIYEYYDSTLQPGVTYYYWLEIVEISRESRLGPVSASAPYPIYIPIVVR